jgi:hypothetical protein
MDLTVALTTKILSICKNIGTFAVERWGEYRRNQFFEALLEKLQIEQASGKKDEEINSLLDDLLKSEENSEKLFDAYRRVCFSKTKKYGPRIIGLLTAELINNATTSNEDEEMIFEAAEKLGDLDLMQFKRKYEELLSTPSQQKLGNAQIIHSGREILEITDEQVYQIGAKTDTEAHLFTSDIRSTHNAWGAILSNCGLLTQSVTQFTRNTTEDSERHVDYDQTWVTTTVTVTYKSALRRLYDLLLRARNEPQ